MKIKRITIAGFRGFNEERTIACNNRLTLLDGPNSYGKTSISEALEWLLYGLTSKVKKAESKDEYKGSYRNRHFPTTKTPFVKLVLSDGSNEIELRGELDEADGIKRFVNGCPAEAWPFTGALTEAPEPFILQHALKNLLLVKPDERFIGFAHILGLDELDRIQRDIVSFCTKPQAHLPPGVDQLFKDVAALQQRVAVQSSLAVIDKALKKGAVGLNAAYDVISKECRRRAPRGTDEQSLLPQLLKIREDTVGRIFKGQITLPDFSPAEKAANANDDEFFVNFVADAFVEQYMALLAETTVQDLIQRAQFFDLGVALLRNKPEECPFCGQAINETASERIHKNHNNLAQGRQKTSGLETRRNEVAKKLTELRERLRTCHNRHLGKAASLLSLDLSQLKNVLLPKHEGHVAFLESAITEIGAAQEPLVTAFHAVEKALSSVEASIAQSREDISLAKTLGEALIQYVAHTRSYAKDVVSHVTAMSEANQILKYELDALAGTEDISLLIELLQRRRDLERKFHVEAILEGLKDLRKAVDQYVANKVLSEISGTLTSDVMEWYEQIKTDGDPDIHFGGFDLERTAKGELKARRVQIKAKSYGRDLVSAVSSLSESKLNALGLCVSIAKNLRANSPLDFLIIDDPIQSWDAEHEVKFIQVIRKLVEERGKQVILMSHNRKWINQVRSGCRTLNGWFYELKGYTVDGPHIAQMPWEESKQRLTEVLAIVEDPTASSIRLQQAEEEIRIVVAEVASRLYLQVKGIHKSPHDLNSSKVRKMLIECGVKPGLVDRIEQTFETTDDAHHAPTDYAAHRQRIRAYHSWVTELMRYL